MTWWVQALAAGHLVYLEAREGSVDGDVLGGLVLYRHGRRLSTAHSADRAERRHDHPGAMHLLRWRAIELALAERRTEMDLGGVDVAGARRPPSRASRRSGCTSTSSRSGRRGWRSRGRRSASRGRGATSRGRTVVARRPGRRAGRGRLVSGDEGTDRRRCSPPRNPPSRGRRRRLIERLRAAGLVRGARRDGLPIGAAGLGDVAVRGVTDDSRAVREGTLFVAVPGFHVDGHDYVGAAAAAGAAAAIVEHPVADAAAAAAGRLGVAGRARPGGRLVVRGPVARASG